MSIRGLLLLLVVVAFLLVIIVFPCSSQAVDLESFHVSGTYNPASTAPNIITNGGFEIEPAPSVGNWQVIASDSSHTATVLRSNDAHTGNYGGVFRVASNPVGGYVALSESTFYWAIGKTYELSFYYKSNLSGCNAEIFCKNAAGNDIAYWTSSMVPSNTWKQATITFGPVPSGTVDLQIHFSPPIGVTGTLQLDDVSTQFGTAPPAPTPNASPTSLATSTPTTPSSTTPNPTNPDSSTQPTPSPSPQIPELSSIAILIIVLTVTGLVLHNRKHLPIPKHSVLVAVSLAILVFALLTHVLQAQSQVIAQTPTSAGVKFSLWFTNGTAFPVDGRNTEGYVNGGMYLNVGGIRCIPSGFGSSSAKITNVVVLRNDGDVPLNVNLALKNVDAPSNVEVGLTYYFMSPLANSPYSDNWLGKADVVTQNPLASGQYLWLGITVFLTQSNVPTTGTPNYSFDYSFDIQVTATQT